MTKEDIMIERTHDLYDNTMKCVQKVFNKHSSRMKIKKIKPAIEVSKSDNIIDLSDLFSIAISKNHISWLWSGVNDPRQCEIEQLDEFLSSVTYINKEIHIKS